MLEATLPPWGWVRARRNASSMRRTTVRLPLSVIVRSCEAASRAWRSRSGGLTSSARVRPEMDATARPSN